MGRQTSSASLLAELTERCEFAEPAIRVYRVYRVTSIIRNCLLLDPYSLLEPYSRPMHMAIGRSQEGGSCLTER